jgi:hypothetical protein
MFGSLNITYINDKTRKIKQNLGIEFIISLNIIKGNY